MEYDTICEAVRESLCRRDERRLVLARQILELVTPALEAARQRGLRLYDSDGADEAARLKDVAVLGELRQVGTLEYRTPEGDCSQWANRMDHPSHRGEPFLAYAQRGQDRWHALDELPDVSFWDGHNWQHQHGRARDSRTGRALKLATVAQLREIARALPGSLARLLSDAQEAAERETLEAEQAAQSLEV